MKKLLILMLVSFVFAGNVMAKNEPDTVVRKANGKVDYCIHTDSQGRKTIIDPPMKIVNGECSAAFGAPDAGGRPQLDSVDKRPGNLRAD